ncbi:hypothetical protein D9599_10095 [Roseomonas sp. KE2513]|uniref:DUF2161 family putative PD-(D/E)XK-type phosphodiesterase n=1 Tax=Roseomonas sp. KE2513 TaxID=2479202 RepID=UPI0018DF9235|nr:DUF2161 family putative PD-(D/E)XK-type phosphodiesterase [Roseomonas sp. KE2513]MBI0535922.1 hypothetical protein [Roseomonas sp. KE2513]
MPRRRRRATPPTAPRAAPETTLYAAVKAHLEGLGYEAKGEVCGCDIVAVRPGEPPFLVVTEMKMGFTLELLLQGVDRMAAADEVWLAVRATTRGRDADRRVRKLCRLLGFGLLAVDPARTAVQVLAEPAPYRPRGNPRRRALLLREHRRRRGDPNKGGATRTPIMTAYRQNALALAAALREGPRRPRDLAPEVPEAGAILLRNVYGWFDRVERGLYRLSPAGEAALLLAENA